MKRVLVIDDDQDILDLVAYNLSRNGYRCFTALNYDSGLQLVFTENPDLVILDIMLPGFNGLALLEELKGNEKTNDIPVIMLTARVEESDRILGLEMGADDYVAKPFSVRELVLRVKRSLDRSKRTAGRRVLECNGISLDYNRHEVWVGSEKVYLTVTEFKLLAYLIRNKGRVASRAGLLEEVWGYSFSGGTRTVDTHIQRLRDKLGAVNHQIDTVRGVGYMMVPISSESGPNSGVDPAADRKEIRKSVAGG